MSIFVTKKIRMKIRPIIACCFCLIALVIIGNAQYRELPTIEGKEINIADCGAIGDGKTLNTTAIQLALDKAKGGGKVLIPKGIYLTGPLTIGSKTTLVIAKDAVLRLTNDIVNYPISDKKAYANFISVYDASDIKITGEGTIDGQGDIWWEQYRAKKLSLRRPQMLYINNVLRIEIAGVTFLNPPNTHISLKNTKNVYIHHITIQAPATSSNTDGINISTQYCTIEHCNINTGDDNIAINFGNKSKESEFECMDIVVKDCHFGFGHGLSIGSYTSGGLKHLAVSNCSFEGTTSAIRIKTARGRGGIVEDLSYQDITIKDSKYPIFISEYYPKEPKTPQEDTTTLLSSERIPSYRNILIKNVVVENGQDAIKVHGLPESPITNLQFINVEVHASNGVQIYNAKQVSFTNCHINNDKGERLTTFQAEVSGIQ